MRQLITVFNELDKNEVSVKLKTACAHCAWARFNGYLTYLNKFDYIYFAGDTFLEQLKISLQFIQNKLLSKITFSESCQMSSENLGGINKRLNTIKQLLHRLDENLKEKSEDTLTIEGIKN